MTTLVFLSHDSTLMTVILFINTRHVLDEISFCLIFGTIQKSSIDWMGVGVERLQVYVISLSINLLFLKSDNPSIGKFLALVG